MPAKKKFSIETPHESPAIPPKFSRRWLGIIVVLIVLGYFGVRKGMFVAAVVNGRPIFRWELTNSLVSRFGKQTLEGMISEALIVGAARKSGVTISSQEVDGKVVEVVKGLGENVKLEEVLQFQGMTKTDFESQIRLQLTVEKLLGKDIEITESDIDAFIATNRATLAATEPAALRQEARNTILGTKISEKIQPWFLEIKEKAKILRFL